MRHPLITLCAKAAPSSSRLATRAFATSATGHSPPTSQQEPKAPAPNSRWLSDLKTRLAKSLSSNLAPAQSREIQKQLDYVQSNALDLLAGREGFLTGARRKGLDRHQVLWGDMDSMGHVNNIIYNRYAESGRVNWALRLADSAEPQHKQEWLDIMTPRSIGLILASIKTDYKFPITYPDQVTVMHKLLQRPDYTSDRIYLEAIIYSEQHQRVAARCFEDIAVYDYQAGKKATLKPFMVDEMQRVYDLQEERKASVEKEMAGLYREMEKLEGGKK